MKHIIHFLLAFSLFVISCQTDRPETPDNLTLKEKYSGCCASTPKPLDAKGGQIILPNIFSPNGDGINDVFYPRASHGVPLILEFEIIDRDEETVLFYKNFYPNDPLLSWDGTYGFGKTYEGKFRYRITYYSPTGEILTTAGSACSMICQPDSILPIVWPGRCGFPDQLDSAANFDAGLPTSETICF